MLDMIPKAISVVIRLHLEALYCGLDFLALALEINASPESNGPGISIATVHSHLTIIVP